MKLSKVHSLHNPYNDKKELKSFKLIKRYKLIEVTLKEGDYLFIPRKWFHCVETKEKTIAINYNFELISIKNENNNLLRSIKDNIPYMNRCNLINIDYTEYINNIFRQELISFFFSNSKYISPIKNPYKEKSICKELSLQEALNEEKNDKYLYKGRAYHEDEKKLKELSKILNFNNILKDGDIKDIFEGNSVWISFNKEINTGLHYDLNDNILYVISGEKKILLAPQKSIIYNYMITNSLINN